MKTNLKTPTSRKKLDSYREPHWVRLPPEIVKGGSLGFRRSPDSGAETWHARVYVKGQYRKTNLGPVTDTFQYKEAYREALEWVQDEKEAGPAPAREYTVQDVLDDYLRDRQGNSSPRLMDKRRQAEKRLDALIPPAIKNKKVNSLEKRDLTKLQRTYSKRINNQGKLIAADSVNRIFAHLIAALNHGHREGMIKTNAEWQHYRRLEESDVKPGAKKDVPKQDRDAFLKACPDALRAICTAMSITAARPSELRRLTVSSVDLNHSDPDQQGVFLISYKGNRSKPKVRLFLLPAGTPIRELFAAQVADKKPDDLVFTTEKGKPWGQANLAKLHNKTRDDNDLHEGLESYIWRHARITEWCDEGYPASEVAVVSGTSLTYIEKNYFKSRTKNRIAMAGC
jgi:integrase